MAGVGLEIVRDIREDALGWPSSDVLEAGRRLGGNRDYIDLRGIPWRRAVEIFAEEREALRGIRDARDVDEEDVDEFEEPGFLDLVDVGVASTVAALSAAGCIPYSSCNGGAFDDHHNEEHPLVAFYARRPHVPLLLAAAAAAEVGIDNLSDGGLLVYSDDVHRMPAFAAALTDRREAFDALHLPGGGPLPAMPVNDCV